MLACIFFNRRAQISARNQSIFAIRNYSNWGRISQYCATDQTHLWSHFCLLQSRTRRLCCYFSNLWWTLGESKWIIEGMKNTYRSLLEGQTAAISLTVWKIFKQTWSWDKFDHISFRMSTSIRDLPRATQRWGTHSLCWFHFTSF